LKVKGEVGLILIYIFCPYLTQIWVEFGFNMAKVTDTIIPMLQCYYSIAYEVFIHILN